MTTDSNKPGPTTLWKTLKGRDVKTNDGKDLGEIKDIPDNYTRLKGYNTQREFLDSKVYLTAKRCGF